jgi:hypothetical protein
MLCMLAACTQVYYGTWRNTAVAIKVLNAQAADSGKLMAEL